MPILLIPLYINGKIKEADKYGFPSVVARKKTRPAFLVAGRA